MIDLNGIIHVFDSSVRTNYDLDSLWITAPEVSLESLGIDMPEDPDSDSDEAPYFVLWNILLLRVAKAEYKWADTRAMITSSALGVNLPVSEQVIRPAKAHLALSERRRQESKAIQSVLKGGDRLVVLDERGETPTTEGLQEVGSGEHSRRL